MRHLGKVRFGQKQLHTNTTNTCAVCSLCMQLFRLCIFARELCFGEAGPLSESRCLLKQGEPKHNQTQVMKPGPLISVTALVPSTKGSSIGSSKWMVPHFTALSICHSLSSL